MAKSNYPDKLDTSIEIPAVRDNIVEVGSDVINSIRTAIFQIERTLGINPQGVAGNTVASRLNKSLDSNGNIIKEAITSSGLLSGPISDKDVSKTAAIKESKLDLVYPTTLLQDEISQISSQLDLIEAAVSDLSTTLAVHINPLAVNRHKGIAINIEAISDVGSDTGITSLENTTSQGAFESLFSSHINYDGTGISADNRSHLSNQIFFDNNNVSTYIASNDAQGAIEDLVVAVVGQSDIHQNRFHSNSIEKSSIFYDANNINRGRGLVLDEAASYTQSILSSDSNISRVFLTNSPLKPAASIEISDILVISDGDITTDYQIFQANESSDGLSIDSVDVYGRFPEDSAAGITASIYRNKNRESSYSGLLLTVRENKSLDGTSYTNADVIQVSNPSATSVVTRLSKPQEITSSNRYIKISVDGAANITLDLFDADLATTTISQNLNSIIKKLNEQFSENRLSVSAYRVDYDDLRKSEIAIVHAIGNSSSSEHTIKISRGSDDCIDSVGFSHIEDITMVADIGNSFYIQGTGYNNLAILLDELNLTLTPGTSEILTGNVNPVELGIKIGDIISITGSTSDDGTYVISSVSSNTIIVNRNQLPSAEWVSSSSVTTRFVVYSDSASLNGIAFKASLGPSSILAIFEVFLDKNRSVNFNEILTYESEIFLGSENLASPCDVFGNTEVYTEASPGSLLFEKADADPADSEILVSLDGGRKVSINHVTSDYVEVYSGKYNIKLLVFIRSSDTISNKINTDGSFSISLYGFKAINKEENILLGKVLYEAGNSRISGFGEDYPRPFRDLRLGATGSKDLGSDVKDEYLIKPHFEKRSNGVVEGLEVYGADGTGSTYTVNISAGICYVKGKRFEISEYENYITDIEAGSPTPVVDKFYVAVDEYGQIVFSPADPVSCACSLDPSSYCILAAVENNTVTVESIDLRLFINDLDFKLLNSITVSPQAGMGHFTEIPKALRYAKRFSEIFPGAGTPTVHLKSGVHKIFVDHGVDFASATAQIKNQKRYEQGFWVNFPVNITGEGESTVIDIVHYYSDSPSLDNRTSDGTNMFGTITVAGPGMSSDLPIGGADVISSGYVNFSNFKLRMCRIGIIDALSYDGNSINFGVNINNVIFDFSEKETFDNNNSGVNMVLRDLTSGDDVGNLSIRNSKFLNSNIAFRATDVEHYFNIIISNNYFGSFEALSVGVNNEYAILCTGSGHIFDVDDCPNINNVFIQGNTTDAQHIDEDENYIWGDRVSANLVVGNNVGIKTSSPENALHVDGKVYIESAASASPSAPESGSLIIGTKLGTHIALDSNDIMARNGLLTDLSNLHLNRQGSAQVVIGEDVFAPTATTVFRTGGGAEVDGNLTVGNSSGDNYITTGVNNVSSPTLSIYGRDSSVPTTETLLIQQDNDAVLSAFTAMRIADDGSWGDIFKVAGSGIFAAPLGIRSPHVEIRSTLYLGSIDFSDDEAWLMLNGSTQNYISVPAITSDLNIQHRVDPASNRIFVRVLGSLHTEDILTAGSKLFKIDHPDPSKKDDYHLCHTSVESPTAGDNIYRFSKQLLVGDNHLDLPDYYKFLNKDTMVWVSPVEHFGRGWGKHMGDEENKIKVCVDQDGIYNILVIGTRKDALATKYWKGPERLKESK